jgi:hypothetical protein
MLGNAVIPSFVWSYPGSVFSIYRRAEKMRELKTDFRETVTAAKRQNGLIETRKHSGVYFCFFFFLICLGLPIFTFSHWT